VKRKIIVMSAAQQAANFGNAGKKAVHVKVRSDLVLLIGI
jgi:hypothetical protein